MPERFPAAELERAVGARPVVSTPIVSGGYGTNSSHWRIELDDGRRLFVKLALDGTSAEWLRAEHRVYASVRARFLPSFAGWHDGPGGTFLVLEDLGDAHWPPPWSARQIDAVFSAMDELHATPPPAGLRALEDLRDWNLACVGNPLVDAVAWLPSLRLEGGAQPWELIPDAEGLAALLAGFFASRAGLPPPETAPTVREFQRRQAVVALEWAVCASWACRLRRGRG